VDKLFLEQIITHHIIPIMEKVNIKETIKKIKNNILK
jgi:hypothetical protein